MTILLKTVISKPKNYLQFLDGIYSFIDNKLYKYEEKPDICFTQQIKRNFSYIQPSRLWRTYEKSYQSYLSWWDRKAI